MYSQFASTLISPLYISIQIYKAIDILLVTGNLNELYVLGTFLFLFLQDSFWLEKVEKCNCTLILKDLIFFE